MRVLFLSLTIIASLALPLHAWAEADPRFSCPYLQDVSRQTLAPMMQGKEGWFFREADMKDSYTLLSDTAEYLSRMNRAFAAQGTQLLLLPVPPRSLAAPQFLDPAQPLAKDFDVETVRTKYENYVGQLKATGVQIPDLLTIAGEYEEANDLYFFFRRDHHWTPFGAKLAAAQVAKLVQELPEYPKEARADFSTEITGTLQIKHSMAQEIQRLCTDTIPPEPYPQYVTSPLQGEGEAALFGDVSAAPPLVLLGSSFSAQDLFNFAGFLAQETGLEVANFAISAGQLFNAIVSYVSLPPDKRLHPDFVLWEALAHYDFNNSERQFRQIIPAIEGECNVQNAIAVKIMHLDGRPQETVFDLQKAGNVSGKDYFIFLQSGDASLTQFTLQLEYDDGDGEWFPIDRSAHYENSGRFFVELSEEITAPLRKVIIAFPLQAQGALEARLCKRSGDSTEKAMQPEKEGN